MARVLVRGKAARGKASKSAKAAKKSPAKAHPRSPVTKPVAAAKSVSRKMGLTASRKIKTKILSTKRSGKHKRISSRPEESRVLQPGKESSLVPPVPPPLLRESRTTSAALSLLEKGIRLIYQKEFRKARAEFDTLLASYPGESEILARTRTYLQICDREELSHKKQAVNHDQLYTMGVMEHNRGNYEGATAYFRQSLGKYPKADYIYYSLAASLTKKGDSSEALASLRKAVELNEDNRVYAKNDEDFSSLHTLNEFAELVGLTQPPPGDSKP
jgi:tetratricopeptide (TPR) repeat protein